VNKPFEKDPPQNRAKKKRQQQKTQDAIFILSKSVKIRCETVKQPKPFAWKTKMSNEFIQKAIEEGRE